MSSLFVGLMSGTSVDAVDVALVDMDISPPCLLTARNHPFPPDLRKDIRRLATQPTVDTGEMGRLDARTGELFAEAALSLIKDAGFEPRDITAIGSHGQTIRHQPNASPPCSVQIGDPNIIVERTGILTVADFRRADMAAGGQGAPLAPAFHAAAFQSEIQNRAILNIGGIANVTQLPISARVTGFDTGPGNTLMDAWARKYLQAEYDEAGSWAREGTVDEKLLKRLLNDSFFKKTPPKSTGTEYFNLEWLEGHLKGWSNAEDVQATLTLLTARSAARAIQSASIQPRRVLVCGGGVHNAYLMELLAAELAGIDVSSTAAVGVDPDWVEAMAFAWLAHRTLAGKPGNITSVTGANHPTVLGGVYGRRGPQMVAD
jgi:anhydro-N-acetylmuramic acid kinase